MTDTPLVHLNAAEAAIARANGHTVYTVPAQECSTADWATPVTPSPTVTFTAKALSSSMIQVDWSGFSPVKIGRDGVDVNGTGPWDTGAIVRPATGSFVFNSLVAGDTYILTATEASGATHTATVTTPVTPVPTPVPTPTPTPTPTPGTYASGLSIPASIPGFVRHFSDFTNGIDSSFWNPPYNGTSNPGGGRFMATHCVVENGVLTLKAYQDSAVNDPAANNWGGAGIQTVQRYPVGTQFWSVCRKDTYGNWFAIQLLMGNAWPPEDDIEETTSSNSDVESLLYGSPKQQVQVQKSGLDLTDWGLWVHTWTGQGITTDLTVKGVTTRIAAEPLPSVNPSDPHSLVNPMFYAFQLQTEYGSTPTDPNAPPRTRSSSSWSNSPPSFRAKP